MQGSRKLTDDEIQSLLNKFPDIRNRCLIMCGLYLGFRVSELISLKVSDILGSHIRVSASRMKGKQRSRTVALNNKLKQVIDQLINQYNLQPDDYLFKSRQGDNSPITSRQANNILKSAINALQLEGKISFHSLRKSYANRVFEASGNNLKMTQVALGHANISSTSHYLHADQDQVDALILGLK